MTTPPSDQTMAAALWLSQQQEPPRAVPTLIEKFNLTAKQACDACRIACDLRRRT